MNSLHFARCMLAFQVLMSCILPTFAADASKTSVQQPDSEIEVASVVGDGKGGVYIAGRFKRTIAKVDPFSLIGIGPMDAFVAKLDSTGKAVWAKNLGGPAASAEARALALDSAGNVFLAGRFATASLSSPSLPKVGVFDGFTVKLDPNGSVIWARSFGGSGARTTIYSIAVDEKGNAIATGSFQGADLSVPRLTKIGDRDILVVKLNSTGTTLWARNFGGMGAESYGTALTTLASENVLVGGHFREASLTTPSLSIVGQADAFALVLDGDGKTKWARSFGGSELITLMSAVAAEDSGNLLLTGNYGSFHSSPGELKDLSVKRIGRIDAFVLKLDSKGNAIWSRNFGGAEATLHSQGISVDDSNGAITIGGYFRAADLLDPKLAKIGTLDLFALKLDENGKTLWARNFGGKNLSAFSNAFAKNGKDGFLIGGYFQAAHFSLLGLERTGVSDGFVVKLNPEGNVDWSRSVYNPQSTEPSENPKVSK